MRTPCDVWRGLGSRRGSGAVLVTSGVEYARSPAFQRLSLRPLRRAEA